MTKKLLAGLLALSMTASAFALPASAVSDAPADAGESFAEESVGKVKKNSKFVYRVNPDGTVSICDLTKKAINSKGVVTIPSKIGGKKVVYLDYGTDEFFRKNWKKIKIVDFPKTVTNLSGGIGYTDEVNAESYYNMYGKSLNGGGGSSYYSYYKRNQKVKIKCYKNSVAEQYAINNNVQCILKDKSAVAPVIIKDNVKIAKTAAKVTWFESANASGYQVFEKDDYADEYKLLKTITGKSNTTLKLTGLKRGEGKSYMIKAFKKTSGGKKFSSESAYFRVITNPGKVTISKTSIGEQSGVGFQFEDPKNRTADYGCLVEVYDSASKKWCGASSYYNFEGGVRTMFVNGFYDKSPNTGREYFQALTPGKKYKVRMCIAGSIYTNTEYGTYKGAYSNTLTLKAK